MLLVLSRYIRFLCYGNHGIPVRAWEKTVYPKWALASLGKVDRSSFHASLLVKHLTCAAERGATTRREAAVFHIGNRIKEIFLLQPKSHNIEWFARQLHCQRANIYKIFNKQTIDTLLLINISRALRHDFFADISRYLNGDSDVE